MSISSFCLEQREKEKEAFKSILAYSIALSAALHLVLALGIALFWSEKPLLADDPIEIVVLDAPEPEVKQPKIETPKPTPQPLVTPTPEKIIPTPTPEPIPTPTPEPIPTPTPEPIPTPNLNTPLPTKVEVPKPLESPVEPKEINEPIKTPNPPIPDTSAETLPPPKISQFSTPQPLQSPLANARNFRDQLTESPPVNQETNTEETPNLPGGLPANQQPLGDNSPATNQPLESPLAENRDFRDRFAEIDNSTPGANPNIDESFTNPGTPGEVTANQENPANKPTVTSQPLQSSTSTNREFRDSFANTNNSPTSSNPGSDVSAANPGVPGEVTANRQIPNRPVGGSKPLQTATNNRGFKDSFTNNNSSPSSATNSNISPTVPGSSSVTTNQPPARRNTRQEGGNREGDRREARRNGRGGRLRCISGCNAKAPPNLRFEDGVQVVIKYVIEADGKTAEPQIVKTSGNEQVDEAAKEAVLKMRFAPPEGGRRIQTSPVTFREEERFSF